MRQFRYWDRLWRWASGLGEQPGRAVAQSAERARLPSSGGLAVGEAEPVSAEDRRAALQRSQKAAALRLFNPAQPVEDRRQLLGREQELGQLNRAILELGMHALVHGARGAGKTSLARAFGDHADEHGDIVLYASCSDDCSFATLFEPYLEDLAEALPRDLAQTVREGCRAGGETLGPRELCALLTRLDGHRVIMIVDEFDRIESPATRAAVATLLKLLSDARVAVRLLIVGIAQDMAGLIGAHASLRRHLVAVGLRRFDDTSAADLFERGHHATGIVFTAEARARITALAVGSPYHLRLFCYATLIAAIERDETRTSAASLTAGLRDAFTLWAGSNPTAAALFERLARTDGRRRDELRALAINALAADPVGVIPASDRHRDMIGSDLFARLAPVLTDPGQGGAHVFEDCLAPQFLLVACHLASIEPATLHDAPRAPASTLHALREVRP